MFDWLKFFPYANRLEPKPSEIQGPYFTKTWHNKWKLNDCNLHFYAPMSNAVYSFNGYDASISKESPGSKNILIGDWQRVYNSTEKSPASQWTLEKFYKNEWCFVGPWFGGLQARFGMTGLLLRADKNHSFSDKNIFHPKMFEAAITNYLDKSFGYTKNGRKAHYRGPLNWQVLPISNSIQAILCDIHEIGNTSIENPLLLKLLFFPITPTAFIYIIFNFGGTQIYRDEVQAKPLFDLCNAIINSFHLEVGPNTQSEWDKVKATCPDMSLTESFGELPWPLTMEKKPKKQKEVDITPHASPEVIEYQSSGKEN